MAYFAGSAGSPQRSAAGCQRVRMRKLFLRGPLGRTCEGSARAEAMPGRPMTMEEVMRRARERAAQEGSAP